MSKRERCRKVNYRVIGPTSQRGIFTARSRANAVAQWRAKFHAQTRWDREAGCWKGVDCEVVA